jgi:transposase
MSMGRRKTERQAELWVATNEIPPAPGHPFYRKLNQLLAGGVEGPEGRVSFDSFVEGLCRGFYADVLGRPSIPPGVYFRMLLIGYFEGIDSERGIAWRCDDSRTLRDFLGYDIKKSTPDHTSLCKVRQRIDLETHREVFAWVLKVLGEKGLLKGKTLGVDATTLEANAAMRSIIRRETGDSYEEFLTKLAQASGIATPTREDLAMIDKKRKNKASNDDWFNPNDSDAKIAKMKDGRTHMAHKAEHAVDLDTGAIVAVTLQGADQGDTTTLWNTIEESVENLREVADAPNAPQCLQGDMMRQVVADKGYHSNDTLQTLAEAEVRTYISEPDRGRRRWQDRPEAQQAVYGNRRRIHGEHGKQLLRRRGELLERSFAHAYETGGMRRVYLRGRENVLKRVLIHVGALNLSLVMRQHTGKGTPRGWQGYSANAVLALLRFAMAILDQIGARVAGQSLETPARPTLVRIFILLSAE